MEATTTLFLKTTRTARISVLGKFDDEVQECWIVMHGYRQLASRFIRQFSAFSTPQRVIVAPEGLSRFYLADQRPHVGASWMTREDREHEIEDQLQYLENLYAHLREQLPSNVRWHLFGFSQGVATVWRWLLKGSINPSSLTICCGILPEESNYELETKLKGIALCNIYALNDEFIPVGKAKAHAELLANTYPKTEVLAIEGPHKLHAEMLTQWENRFVQHLAKNTPIR
ncbi:MAG: alpha/beta hydrolase [Bacteroidia bacterium]